MYQTNYMLVRICFKSPSTCCMHSSSIYFVSSKALRVHASTKAASSKFVTLMKEKVFLKFSVWIWIKIHIMVDSRSCWFWRITKFINFTCYSHRAVSCRDQQASSLETSVFNGWKNTERRMFPLCCLATDPDQNPLIISIMVKWVQSTHYCYCFIISFFPHNTAAHSILRHQN